MSAGNTVFFRIQQINANLFKYNRIDIYDQWFENFLKNAFETTEFWCIVGSVAVLRLVQGKKPLFFSQQFLLLLSKRGLSPESWLAQKLLKGIFRTCDCCKYPHPLTFIDGPNSRTSHRRCSFKKAFLERDFGTGVFLWILRNF